MARDILVDEKNFAKGYQVRVKDCLSEDFLAWLDLTGSYDPQSHETLLLVATTDQAALYGLLNRLRDSGINPDFCGESACPKLVMPAPNAKKSFRKE